MIFLIVIFHSIFISHKVTRLLYKGLYANQQTAQAPLELGSRHGSNTGGSDCKININLSEVSSRGAADRNMRLQDVLATLIYVAI